MREPGSTDQHARLLIVDDEPEVCKSLEDEFRHAGYHCASLTDPQAARELLCHDTFDVVITDLAMPRLTGMQLLGEIRKCYPQTQVILISGVGTLESAKDAIRHGAYDYLQKPFQSELIHKVVEGALQQRIENSQERREDAGEVECRDGLTGLLSQRYMHVTLPQIRKRCRSENTTCTILLADIFKFSDVNEKVGIADGDVVLQEVASRIRRVVRRGDLLMRHEGDWFGVVLVDAPSNAVRKLAERMKSAVNSQPFHCQSGYVNMNLNIGWATSEPGFLISENMLIDRSRAAVAEALKQGGGSIRSWDELNAAVVPSSKQDSLEEMNRAVGEIDARLRNAYLESAQALVAAVEAKDKFTEQHSFNVRTYAQAFGKELGFSDSMLQTLRLGALLHDIGKIGVPDEILLKNGPLTDEEYTIVQRHPQIGARIIEQASFLRQVVPAVLHHHEWWDGSGYPDGLAGEQIPFAARLVHVADAVDTMRGRRVYKDAYPLQRVLDELDGMAGRQFDPKLAPMAIRVLQDEPDLVNYSDVTAA